MRSAQACARHQIALLALVIDTVGCDQRVKIGAAQRLHQGDRIHHVHRPRARKLAFCIAALSGLGARSHVVDEHLASERTLEVILPERAVIDPAWIGPSADGDLIVAGSIESLKVAWASKLDSRTGRAIWTFKLGRDGLTDAPTVPGFGASPNVVGVVPSTHVDSFLCGNIPPPTPKDKARVFYAWIDSVGGLKSREVFDLADHFPNAGYGAVHACVAWGNRIGVFGTYSAFERSPGADPPRMSTYYYWIEVLDQTGHLAFAKTIQLEPNFFPDPQGSVVIPHGSGMLLSATGSAVRALDTELVSVSESGDIRARTVLKRQQLYLVRNAAGVSETAIQLFGRDGTGIDSPKVLLTLDTELGVTARHSVHIDWVFSGPFVFRTSDLGLVAFGMRVSSAMSPQLAAVLLLDRDLKARGSFFFELSNGRDSGRVWAAGSLGARGEFAAARAMTSAQLGDPRLGMTVDLIRVR